MSGPTTPTLRPALAELPVRPLHQLPKPVISKLPPNDIPVDSNCNLSTPPATPPKSGIPNSAVSADGIAVTLPVTASEREESSKGLQSVAGSETSWADGIHGSGFKIYNHHYQLREELGHGVWSQVYLATEIPELMTQDDSLPSPPTSPTNISGPIKSKTLAVKVPSRRDAYQIMEKEAKILTFLHSGHGAESYLVPFYGFNQYHQSIILDAVPLNLEIYAKAARNLPLSTKTMFDPITGRRQWMCLAEALIDGLAFLHRQGCVHGDIKPANILVRSDPEDTITPLYCDFSSSRLVADIPSLEVEAVTTEYTSPELLSSFYNTKNERAVASFASDVFALAVTLLFTAIGESPYACAHLELQKLVMAKDGTPIEYARRGQQASRIMKGQLVEKALTGGLLKDPGKRSTIDNWKAELTEAFQA